MKNLFLFAWLSVLAISFNSCSNDDGADKGGKIAFKYDGVSKSFSPAKADKLDEGASGIYLALSAAGKKPTDFSGIGVYKGAVGTDKIDDFTLMLEGDTSHIYKDHFRSTITINNGMRVKGTFYGEVYFESDGTTHTISEGTFDINY